jgi:hypothetical protein
MHDFRVCYTVMDEPDSVRKRDNFRDFHTIFTSRVLKVVGKIFTCNTLK